MPLNLIGAHMPTSGGLGKAVTSGKAIGCTAVQVFTSSPQQWKAKVIDDAMVAAFLAAKTETGIECVVSHDSYLINLCAPTGEAREKSIAGLSGEVERCARYGIDRVVSHLGGHMGQGEDEGIRLIVESLKIVLSQTSDSVTVLAETTAGQGTSIIHTFESLARIIDGCGGHPRLGVCMDTCHIFAAGYDIRTPETYEQTMATFQKVIGFDRLMAVHCNDSKKDFGSKVDRHEHIGEGKIGIEAFRCLVNDDRFANIPVLLETPEAETMHETNLNKLKSLMA